MNDLKVCWWPIDKPIAYSRNRCKIPERAIDKVAASIKEFGWRQAIVVDKDGVIICGAHPIARGTEAGAQAGSCLCRRQFDVGSGQSLPADGQPQPRGDRL